MGIYKACGQVHDHHDMTSLLPGLHAFFCVNTVITQTTPTTAHYTQMNTKIYSFGQALTYLAVLLFSSHLYSQSRSCTSGSFSPSIFMRFFRRKVIFTREKSTYEDQQFFRLINSACGSLAQCLLLIWLVDDDGISAGLDFFVSLKKLAPTLFFAVAPDLD